MKAPKIQNKLKEMPYPPQKKAKKKDAWNWPKENLPFMRLILEEQQKYLHSSIILHINPWTLMLMLHIRQSIYFWQMFYLIHFWCSTLHSMEGKGRCTQYMLSNDMFVLWNCISAIFYEDRKYCLHIFAKQHTLVH